MIGFLLLFMVGLVAGGVATRQLVYGLRQRKKSAAQGDTPSQVERTRKTAVTESAIEPSATAEENVSVPPAAPSGPDKLNAIRGVGPIYAQRLNQAGIYTFAQLAALTPKEVGEIVRPGKSQRLLNTQAWIDQAARLAHENDAVK